MYLYSNRTFAFTFGGEEGGTKSEKKLSSLLWMFPLLLENIKFSLWSFITHWGFFCLLADSIHSNSILFNLIALAEQHLGIFRHWTELIPGYSSYMCFIIDRIQGLFILIEQPNRLQTFCNQPSGQPNSLLSNDGDRNPKVLLCRKDKQ